jgi:cytoskeletal protein RodZ
MRPSPAAVAIGWIANLIVIAFVLMLGYLLWPYAVKQWQSGPPMQATAQPALSAPTPYVAPPQVISPNPPIVVQQAPAGEAPQPVQFQPIAAPADSASDAEPAPRPLIIVQHVDDSGHQVITGSGACAVARSARRCGK